MKNCIECGASKALRDYYAHPKTADGRMGVCVVCHKARMKKRRMTDPRVQEYDLKRSRHPERKAKMAIISRQWRIDNPDGYRAHTAVGNAVRDGRLIKQPCVECGSTERLHAHHHDYSKPLDVTWYCALHHHRHHHHPQS